MPSVEAQRKKGLREVGTTVTSPIMKSRVSVTFLRTRAPYNLKVATKVVAKVFLTEVKENKREQRGYSQIRYLFRGKPIGEKIRIGGTGDLINRAGS